MGNLFSLFCSTLHAVLNMFARLFQIKQVTALKKVKQELFTSMKYRNTKT